MPFCLIFDQILPTGQEVLTPDLTPGGELSQWTEAGFIITIRTGTTPTGRRLSKELSAVRTYLRSLQPLPQGR